MSPRGDDGGHRVAAAKMLGTMLLPDDPHVYAFTRRLGPVELLVLGHVTAAERVVDLPDGAAWAASEVVVGDPVPEGPGAGPDGAPHGGPVLVLRPWEGRVHRRRHD